LYQVVVVVVVLVVLVVVVVVVVVVVAVLVVVVVVVVVIVVVRNYVCWRRWMVGEQNTHSSGGSHTVPLLSVANSGTGRKAELSEVN
jgi:uncharacterized membrane protein